MTAATSRVATRVAGWPLPETVEAWVTRRSGGVSVGRHGLHDGGPGGLNLGARCGDDPRAVSENRRRLSAELPGVPCWLEQVHGIDVHHPDPPALSVRVGVGGDRAEHEPRADAAVTCTPGRVLAILSADCLPVLFSDLEGRRVGAAHAGWRGLAAGVLERTVAALREMPGPSDALVAWLGPAIGPDAFEVGDDVLQAFVERDPGAIACFRRARLPDKWFADLFGLARRRLAALGIDRVGGGNLCTVADARCFYSHRRDRGSGRFASLIWIRP